MANGLRKLIRKARRFSNPLITNRRLRKFGTRLKVEELEERIAPAAVTLSPGEFTTWDITGGVADTWDATDGLIGLTGGGTDSSLTTTAGVTMSVTVLDDTAPSITAVTIPDATATVNIGIVSNLGIGDIDLSSANLDEVTTLRIVVMGGRGGADGTDANEITFTHTNTETYSVGTYDAGTGGDPGDGGTATALAAAGIGTITLPTTGLHASGLDIIIQTDTHATGTLAGISSTSSSIDLIADGTKDSYINAGAITSLVIGGSVAPGAAGQDITIAATNDAGAGITTLSLRDITVAGAGNAAINSEGIDDLDITAGIAASSTGAVSIDADAAGATDDAMGAVDIAGITISGAGGVTIDGGDTGFSSTVGTGAIAVSSSGDLSITTSTNGSFAGLVTTGAITNTSTTTANITIQPAGTGDMNGFTATGLISNDAAAVDGALVIGSTSGTLGAVSLAGVTVSSTSDSGDVTFQGESIGTITSSAAIQTASGAAGDIVINAAGATDTGSMGNISVTAGGIVAGQANATIAIQANDDIGTITVTGNIGGAGAIAITADNGGTADTGDIGNISVSGGIGLGGSGAVTISGVDIGTIDAASIGAAGAVTITADGLDATDGAGGGVVGNIGSANTLVSIGQGAAVTINADDGVGTIDTTGSIASGGNVTINANVDATDDTGSIGAITSATQIGTAGGFTLTLNTNGGANDDNTTERTIGAISASTGFARLDITSDGDIGLITVTGGSGSGNDLEIVKIDTDNTVDPSNTIDFGGINVADTSGTDSVWIDNASEIPGRIWNAGANGSIIAGGGDASDYLRIDPNLSIYNGDDESDGFDDDYAASLPFEVQITTGYVTGTGLLIANTLNSSPLFTAVLNGETFQVDASTTGVSARITYDPAGGSGGDEQVAVDDITGLTSATELTITTSGSSEFDVDSITLASTASGQDASLIRIEGDLQGDIGEATAEFGTVETILIEGDAGASVYTFFGTGISGLGTGSGTLLLGPNVIISVLDREVSEPLTINGGINFQFADTAGAAASTFNLHIGVVGAGSEAVVYGIDGNGDSTAVADYLFDGNGVSAAQTGATNAIDPSGLLSGAAMVSRISLDGVTGLETDVSVREVEGTTSGSWLEFESSVGLVNLTTQLDSISVGIDDGADLVDNVVLTGVAHQGNTRDNIDRLGGGQAGGAKRGLEPATSISDATAAMGNFVAQSMGDPGATNINIVVTGSTGPITLTGDLTEDSTPDHGDLDSDTGSGGAAIAIGDNAEGAITIPGDVDGDILIGIGLDTNGDSDVVDSGEAPGGNLNGNVTIGDMGGVDILVAGNVTSDIVITGADQDLEDLGLELDGDLRGIKATGDLGVLGADVVVVTGDVNYIVADGAMNSGIFVGGDGDWVSVEGTGINGPGVVGATSGVYYVEFIDHEAAGDLGDYDWIYTDYAMTVQWAAGAFTDTLDVLGDVYMFNDDNGYLEVYTEYGDAMNIGDIYQLEYDDIDVYSPADIGVFVAAEGVNILTSEQLQDLITTTYDVVNGPTDLDTTNGDDEDMLIFDGSIHAANAGGVVAEGDIEISAVIGGSIGDLISLNGYVEACSSVHAGVSIGSIVASEDISGDFISEGTLAVGTVLDVSTYGLSGVPSWFTGGVLTEVGDIVYGSTFRADGDSEMVGGVVVSTGGDTMGTFYVLAGNMGLNTSNYAEIFCYGDFGGIQVGAGNAYLYIKVVGGEIDTMIAPYYYQSGYSIRPEANIEATNGEKIVSANNGYALGNVSVTVSSGVIGFVDPGDNYHIDELMLLNLGSGASASVMGDLEQLSIEGNWGGTVTVSGSALGETDGVVDTISVDGNIESTAVLNAANFFDLLVSGTTDSNVTDSGTLTSSNPSDPVMMAGSQVATIFLDGTSNVQAAWTAVFGKVMTVDVTGNGKADLVLAEGTVSEAALEDIASAGEVGDGGANLGDLSVANKVKLDDVVVQGSADSMVARQINDLWISGGAGDLVVGKLNNADIGDDVNMLTVQKAKNVTVDGDVETIHAYKLQSATILGTTGDLYMTGTRAGCVKGQILNSIFAEGVGYQNFNLDDPYDHVKVRNTTGLY